MLYRISVTERGLTDIANIFRSRLSRLDDLLGAGTVPLNAHTDVLKQKKKNVQKYRGCLGKFFFLLRFW